MKRGISIVILTIICGTVAVHSHGDYGFSYLTSQGIIIMQHITSMYVTINYSTCRNIISNCSLACYSD